jgi:hypothetical protein
MGMHNQFRGGGMGIAQNNPQYGRRERPSTIQPQDRRPQIDKPINNRNRAAYTPNYEKPRMSTRPAFNNSRPNSGINEQRRAAMQRGMDNGNMRNSAPTQSRTYTTPSRNYAQPQQQQSQSRREFMPAQSRSDFNSAPSRSYSAPSQSSGSYSGSSQSSSGSSSSGSARPRR